MNLILLDTDVASFIFKNSPVAKQYQYLLSGSALALSFMVSIHKQWSNDRFSGISK